MEVFWAKGYEAASLCDLTEAMGLSKSSFYDTFGGKNDLFVAAIDRYRETVQAKFLAELQARRRETGSARAAIAALFDQMVDSAVRPDGGHGCFLGNCAVEIAGSDAKAAARVRAAMKATENAYHEAVKAGQDQGEIALDRDARALARSLTSSQNGLLVMAKLDPDEAALRDIAKLAVSVLD